MSLILAIIGFAKSCGKGRLNAPNIKMGGISEAAHSEIRNPLSALLGNKGGNRGGGGTSAVPESEGRHIENVREKNALKSEVTE